MYHIHLLDIGLLYGLKVLAVRSVHGIGLRMLWFYCFSIYQFGIVELGDDSYRKLDNSQNLNVWI